MLICLTDSAKLLLASSVVDIPFSLPPLSLSVHLSAHLCISLLLSRSISAVLIKMLAGDLGLSLLNLLVISLKCRMVHSMFSIENSSRCFLDASRVPLRGLWSQIDLQTMHFPDQVFLSSYWPTSSYVFSWRIHLGCITETKTIKLFVCIAPK